MIWTVGIGMGESFRPFLHLNSGSEPAVIYCIIKRSVTSTSELPPSVNIYYSITVDLKQKSSNRIIIYWFDTVQISNSRSGHLLTTFVSLYFCSSIVSLHPAKSSTSVKLSPVAWMRLAIVVKILLCNHLQQNSWELSNVFIKLGF